MNEVTLHRGRSPHLTTIDSFVDGQHLTEAVSDGLILSTPTGSTAYAFSAGGPVVWPGVQALLLVPISAHALFARPLVLGPDSHLAVEVVPHSYVSGVMWCDGRRTVELPPGARIEVQRSATPVLLARFSPEPFTDRLVEKFDLSVHGWRGAARRANGSDPEAG